MTLADLFSQFAEGATSLAQGFVNIFQGITPIFWQTGADGAGGQLTIVSVFTIGGVLLTLGFWGIDKLLSLAKMGLGGLTRGRAKRSKAR